MMKIIFFTKKQTYKKILENNLISRNLIFLFPQQRKVSDINLHNLLHIDFVPIIS